ncbi:PEPxxWA-CTERM sorting domain-containing protein [uncultured Sphingomonas sp.]|uniref:PEPxxWA-CTERM sorting domain-containing protein n=1 Tax=uncultured Sphingomonas sp. TaxID=158754 RepID=UPI00261EAD92|nr:PEPxxWA-CTERM sorting domain-containing protein [uncultured Sphingomonas sp.]
MLPKVSRMKIGARGKRLVVLGLFAASGVGSGYIALDRSGAGIGGAKAAVMAALADPLAMFTDRSPGARGAGALTQTKERRERVASNERSRPEPKAAPKPLTPVERVLTSVRERPPFVDEGGLPFADSAGPIMPPVDFAGPGQTPFGPSIPPFVPPLGGNPTPPINPPVNPPTGAVPEPATWGMMLIGFFAVGAALRRRRGALAAAVGNR